MTREEKIAKIYEVIARKDLSFGCKIVSQVYENNMIITEIFDEGWDIQNYKDWDNWYLRYLSYSGSVNVRDVLFVIWHPVMIWDVLDWIEKNTEFWLWTWYDWPQVSDHMWQIAIYCGKSFWWWLWKNMRQPIENQSDECIDYIYNLITNNG